MIEFSIPSMTCGHCVGRVTQAVQQVDPQAKVVVDLKTHKVQVETGTDRAAIAASLREAGYEPA